jgi:hypothetical protein
MKNMVREELVIFEIENRQIFQDFLGRGLSGDFGGFLFLFLVDSIALDRTFSRMMVINYE